MVGKWRLFSQYINGEKLCIVGRQRDISKILHSGNIEYAEGAKYTDEATAQALADELNGKEEGHGQN